MSPDLRSRWTVVAHLLRPQGRAGELLAELMVDIPEHLTDHPGVFLAAPGFTGEATEARPAEVTGYWLPTGRNRGRIVLAFRGIDSISDAERLAGLDVLIPTEERAPLEPGAEYVDALIGCTVLDGTTIVGTLDAVQFPTTPEGRRMEDVAPLLSVVTSDGDEVLVPYVKDFLVEVDTSARRIEMTLPAGLVDLNRSKP